VQPPPSLVSDADASVSLRVPMNELLTPSFMARRTRFSNADEMFDASAWRIVNDADFAAVPADIWDGFVRSVSKFADWNSMLREAATEWKMKRLGIIVE